MKYISNNGEIFGGYYNITYQSIGGKDLKDDIEKILHEFNSSLSVYDSTSIISRINNNDTTVRIDKYFNEMYQTAHEVSDKTNGAFDITVAPLVRAWGFGGKGSQPTKKPNIDSLLQYVGYKKIFLQKNRLIKTNKEIKLDPNALAPGQAADVIARYLEKKRLNNYLIEIGGEIICKGVNPKGEKWRIGVDKPVDDPADENKELQIILALTDKAVATSGNYREFYYKAGKKYSHTIDPKTGRPVDHHLLSATVIAPTCAKADAYATACMVLGVEKAIKFCENNTEIECYLIYSNEKGEFETKQTKKFSEYIAK